MRLLWPSVERRRTSADRIGFPSFAVTNPRSVAVAVMICGVGCGGVKVSTDGAAPCSDVCAEPDAAHSSTATAHDVAKNAPLTALFPPPVAARWEILRRASQV